jgi:two-component system chemotaxis response regulator CheB
MPGRDTVVIAASAGGVEALRALVHHLPCDLPAALLVVVHVPPTGGTVLPKILSRAGSLPVHPAVDGEPVQHGMVYVAPPDQHLLVVGDVIKLSQGPRHNGVRPSADPLFISAAIARGERTIAVVLSGTLDDGAAGCAAIESRGGLVTVQDPQESAYDGMPRAAMAAAKHPRVLRLAEIAALITSESHSLVPPEQLPNPPPDSALQQQLAFLLEPVPPAAPGSAPWSGVTCPECGSPLRQKGSSPPLRFECPAGHVWSPESLVTAQAAGIERVLWSAALRLEERARLNSVLAEQAEARGNLTAACGFRATAHAARTAAHRIRSLLESASMGPSPGTTT